MTKSESPLKDVLKNIIVKLEEEKGEDGGLIAVWEKVVGKSTSKHTRPTSLKGERLVVIVGDSSRLYDLTLKKYQIIKNLNKNLKKKKIKEIRFRIGEV